MRLWIAIAVGLAGCGAAGGAARGATTATEGPAASSRAITASEGAQNGGEAPPGDQELAAGTATSEAPVGVAPEDIVTVRPRFQPDPIIRAGIAGGPRSAEEISPECRGFVADEPDHVLKVDQEVPGLRVMVAMRGDATLVIELADGRMLCNDDSEGLNPIVSGPFPPGRHRVWVGTYGQTPPGGVPYTIAFTATPGVSTGTIEGLRPTP